MITVYIVCTILLIFIPTFKGMRSNELKIYDQREREFKLKWIQKYYPELRKLSWEEIERRYPVSRLYDNIR